VSHNIVLTGVRYDDLRLLGEVVKDLSKGKATLKRDQKNFRTYSGQPTNCDHCIAMPGRHDIGLRRNKEGSYDMIFDPYGMDNVFQAKGGKYIYGESAIGAVAQEYVLRAAEIRAAQQGYTTNRIPGKDGNISLEIAVS
jgi:hypothetical protein